MADEHDAERPDAEDEGGPVKSFLEHLEDLRWVLIKTIVAMGIAMLICLVGANYVVTILKWPLERARLRFPGTNQVVTVAYGTNKLGTFQLTGEQEQALELGTNRFVAVEVEPLRLGTNHVLGWKVSDNPELVTAAQQMKIDLINLSPAGGFIVALQVALYGGSVLAAPFILYFILAFVFPALRMREQKYVRRGLFFGGGLFLAGVSFCYFVLMPLALAVSQSYSSWLGFGAFQWRAEDYISFVSKFMIGMGLGFELPVVLLTLVKIGVLSYGTLRGMWRYMIVIVLILGGFLTTPEVVTQVMMALPLYMLYEISVWIAWYWQWRDRRREAAQHPSPA
jgi:sec-independent protein translocase protein TatC